MKRLGIISGSVRQGRGGIAVAAWIAGIARSDPRYDTDLIDLGELNLPMHDEPNHPRLKQYVHAHSRSWSTRIEKLDAFIFITPEYNYSIPAGLKNAIDYLSLEWADKPAAIASYGGISGGLRAAQHLKHILGATSTIVINEAIVAPLYANQISDGQFLPSDLQTNALDIVLNKLAQWHTMLAER